LLFLPFSAGETRLLRAVVAGDVALVGELIGKGADVDLADNAGCSPLHAAANTDIAKMLLEVGWMQMGGFWLSCVSGPLPPAHLPARHGP
jgi:hypothetical protein